MCVTFETVWEISASRWPSDSNKSPTSLSATMASSHILKKLLVQSANRCSQTQQWRSLRPSAPFSHPSSSSLVTPSEARGIFLHEWCLPVPNDEPVAVLIRYHFFLCMILVANKLMLEIEVETCDLPLSCSKSFFLKIVMSIHTAWEMISFVPYKETHMDASKTESNMFLERRFVVLLFILNPCISVNNFEHIYQQFSK